MASWMKQLGNEQSVLDYVASLDTQDSPARLLAFRAAALTGLGRFRQAQLVHRERVRLEPNDPLPYLDSARIYLLMAEQAVELRISEGAIDPNVQFEVTSAMRARPEIPLALRLHEHAMRLAVDVSDSTLLVTGLIARAGCRIAIGEYDAALRDLDLAIDQDGTRLEAGSLRLRCIRLRANAAEAASAPPVPTSVARRRSLASRVRP